MAAFAGAEIHEDGFSSQPASPVQWAAIKGASVMPDINGYTFWNTVDPAQASFWIPVRLEAACRFSEECP